MRTGLLEFSNVTIAYDQHRVVQDMSFTVEKGEILAIVGESGSGKSTILKSIFGLLGDHGQICQGQICFREMNLADLPKEKRRQLYGQEIAMVFQNSENSFHPFYTIEENLYLFVRAHQRPEKREIRKKALDLLELMNITEGERFLKSYPFELSGGMNQKAGIMMAMILEPKLILCDEPTSSLDAVARKQVLDILSTCRKMKQWGMIVVSHDLVAVERIADKILVIHQGRLVEYGDKEKILAEPQHEFTKKMVKARIRLKEEQS